MQVVFLTALFLLFSYDEAVMLEVSVVQALFEVEFPLEEEFLLEGLLPLEEYFLPEVFLLQKTFLQVFQVVQFLHLHVQSSVARNTPPELNLHLNFALEVPDFETFQAHLDIAAPLAKCFLPLKCSLCILPEPAEFLLRSKFLLAHFAKYPRCR